MKAITNFSIKKSGQHLKLEFANTYNTELWPIDDIYISERTGNTFVIGVPPNIITLDYTVSTEPTANSLNDYISIIQELINTENFGEIDSGNSTSDLLTASTTFVGDWYVTTNYSQFTCLVSTDQPGDLYLDISTDGVNIDRSKIIPVVSPGAVHTLVVLSKYMRIRLINGVIDQGYLRIQTILHKTKSKELTSTTSQVISDRNDVNLYRQVNDHMLDMARGIISDKKVVHIFGANPLISTVPEDIWGNGGDYNFLSSASVLEILSNNIQDDASGLGAQTVKIFGLDQNYDEIEEVVSLVGSGVSLPTTSQFIRVNNAIILSVGTQRGANYNNIIIRVPTLNTIVANIGGGYGTIDTVNYGIGSTRLGLYTVPAGYTAYISRIEVNIESNKTGDIFLYTVDNSNITSPRNLLWNKSNLSGTTSSSFTTFFKINEKSDIWIRGVASAISNIEVNIDLFVIHNEF